MPLITPPINNIKEVTEPLKEQILKGNVHTVELLRSQLEVTTKDIESVIIMELYHHRDLIGSREAFIKGNLNI